MGSFRPESRVEMNSTTTKQQVVNQPGSPRNWNPGSQERSMTFSWNHALLDQLAFGWEVQFLPRTEGLTDAEYLWEPALGCWSVRLGEDGRWRQDLADREPNLPPFTTIAWRLAHIATVFGERVSNHFGDGSFDPMKVAQTSAADDALALVTA